MTCPIDGNSAALYHRHAVGANLIISRDVLGGSVANSSCHAPLERRLQHRRVAAHVVDINFSRRFFVARRGRNGALLW